MLLNFDGRLIELKYIKDIVCNTKYLFKKFISYAQTLCLWILYLLASNSTGQILNKFKYYRKLLTDFSYTFKI